MAIVEYCGKQEQMTPTECQVLLTLNMLAAHKKRLEAVCNNGLETDMELFKSMETISRQIGYKTFKPNKLFLARSVKAVQKIIDRTKKEWAGYMMLRRYKEFSDYLIGVTIKNRIRYMKAAGFTQEEIDARIALVKKPLRGYKRMFDRMKAAGLDLENKTEDELVIIDTAAHLELPHRKMGLSAAAMGDRTEYQKIDNKVE